MTPADDLRRDLSALRPDELAAIGRNREAVEQVIGRVVDDLGRTGAAALLRSVAARMEARDSVPVKYGRNTDGV
jgi:hypothetical protein